MKFFKAVQPWALLRKWSAYNVRRSFALHLRFVMKFCEPKFNLGWQNKLTTGFLHGHNVHQFEAAEQPQLVSSHPGAHAHGDVRIFDSSEAPYSQKHLWTLRPFVVCC